MNTRGFIALILIALSLGCASRRSKSVQLSSDVKMADRSSAQLISGFHGVEGNGWRWTARRFAVVLPPPPGSGRDGATLRLHLFIPDSQIAKLGPLTLTADIDDLSLPPETFSKAGALLYSRDVPPALLGADLLPVVFTFDKASAPSDFDGRELAAVVTEVSLERKN